MCIAAWVWRSHPLYPLILLFNRDELLSRPTDSVRWWGWGKQKILGGRDIKAGGTWMGCTKEGRLAFLTNVMEIESPNLKTRGDLPVMFLESRKSPLEFAEDIAVEADQYNGFNLILADLCAKIMIYVSNRPKGQTATVQVVTPGLHVLTNARLDTPWPKAQRLRRNFREFLHKHRDVEIPAKEMVKQLMGDRVKASRDQLPETGYGSDLELMLSSIFVEGDCKYGEYGTRSQAALTMRLSGEVSLYEQYLEENQWKEHTVEYQIEGV